MLPSTVSVTASVQLKANDEIFQKTIDVIRHKNGLVILPKATMQVQEAPAAQKGHLPCCFSGRRSREFHP